MLVGFAIETCSRFICPDWFSCGRMFEGEDRPAFTEGWYLEKELASC